MFTASSISAKNIESFKKAEALFAVLNNVTLLRKGATVTVDTHPMGGIVVTPVTWDIEHITVNVTGSNIDFETKTVSFMHEDSFFMINMKAKAGFK